MTVARPTDSQLAGILEESARNPLAAALVQLLEQDRVYALERQSADVRAFVSSLRQMVGVSIKSSGKVRLVIGQLAAILRASDAANAPKAEGVN